MEVLSCRQLNDLKQEEDDIDEHKHQIELKDLKGQHAVGLVVLHIWLLCQYLLNLAMRLAHYQDATNNKCGVDADLGNIHISKSWFLKDAVHVDFAEELVSGAFILIIHLSTYIIKM